MEKAKMRGLFVGLIFSIVTVTLALTTQVFANTTPCKNYPVGQSTGLPLHLRQVNSAQFSPDGNSVVTASGDWTSIVYNLKTKESHKIQHSRRVNSAQFSPDGNSVVTAARDGTAVVYNLKTKESREIQHSDEVNSARFSPDGNSVVTASDDRTALVYNLKTKESHKIQHSKWVKSAQFSPDGNSVVTASGDGTAIVYNLKTKESHKIEHSNWVNSAQFSPDGNSVVTASYDRTALVYNLKTKESHKIQHSNWVKSAQFSPDSNLVVTVSNNGTAIVYNLKTKESHKFEHSDLITSAQFSPDGNSVITASNDRTVIIYSLKTKESHKIQCSSWVTSAKFSPDGNSVVTALEDGTIQITQLFKACIDPSLKVATSKRLNDPQICIKCEATDKLLDQAQNLAELSVEAICQKDYSKLDWDKVTPKIDLRQGSLSEKTAMLYLLRFQKAGSFETKAHLPILHAILKSDLVAQKPELISNALVNVLSISNQLFEALLEEFPNLRKPIDTKETSKPPVCQNEKDKNAFAETAIEYLRYKKSVAPKRAKISDWQDLGAISNVLTQLTPAQKESALYDIAFSLADGAADDMRYRGIFYSKIFQFTKRAAMPWFGLTEENKPLTDLSLIRERNQIQPVLMGEAAIDDATGTKTDYGFFIKSLPKIEIPSDVRPGDKS